MRNQKDPPLVILSRALPAGVIFQMVIRIGFAVVATVFGPILLGLLIDTRITNTKPLFTLLLGITGAIASVWVTYKLAMGTVPKARKAYEEWAESKKNNGGVEKSR